MYVYVDPSDVLDDLDVDELEAELANRRKKTGSEKTHSCAELCYEYFRSHPQQVPQALKDAIFEETGRII